MVRGSVFIPAVSAPAVQSGLRAASQDVQAAWTTWQTVAYHWDRLSTGHHRAHPVAAESGDLAMRTARLAHRDLGCNASLNGNGPIPEPSTLASAAEDLGTVFAAVHNALEASTRTVNAHPA